MDHRITDQSFYKYLKCPSWLAREAAGEGDVRDQLMQKLQDEGLLREREIELLEGRDYVEVELDDIDEAAQYTLELMRDGVQTIYHGALVFGRYVGRPDLLERVEGTSDLGDYYYVACDIKRSHHLKDEYKFQGAFYAEILEQIQGIAPVQGYVMHADGQVETYLLEDFITDYHLTLEEIERVLDGEVEPHFLTSGCKQSPWFTECEAQTRQCNDLSLLNRVWRSEVRALNEAGIDTVDKLADASVEKLKTVAEVTMDRLYFLQQQAIAMIDQKVVRLGEIDLPAEEGVALVVDIESDPLHDVDYLFGVLLVDGENQTYHSFLAEDLQSIDQAWYKFVEFIAEYPSANLYHYGWYEQAVFARLSERYGAPESVKRMFENQMIDVLVAMREKVIFPLPFYSLKDIAKYLGFKWRRADASGLNSILWYEQWLSDGDREALQDVVDYNEDDVRATWFVRCWAIEGEGHKGIRA